MKKQDGRAETSFDASAPPNGTYPGDVKMVCRGI
jgi:hypothetical protein